MLDVGLAPPSGQEEAVAPKHRHREARNALPRHLAPHVSVDRIERGRRGRRLNGRGEQHREKERRHGLTFGFCSATLGRGLRGWRNDTGTGSGAKARRTHVARRGRPGRPAAPASARRRRRRAPAAQHPEPSAGAGVRTSLLRILMTNACSFNCHYCPMRRDRDMPRTLLKPEELVRIFLGARRRGWCEGLFVTTGIPGPAGPGDGRSRSRALELLRERHRFGGYIHVKLVPGAEAAQIERLTQLASRVSLNFEAPCGASLARIAPEKSFATTLGDFEQVRGLVVREREARAHGRPADPLHPGGASGMTMQFVVGATPDTDRASCRHREPAPCGAAEFITPTSAPSGRSATRRWSTSARRRPCGSTGSTRRTTCCATYGFGADEVVYEPERQSAARRSIPRAPGRSSHPERFPVEVTHGLVGGAAPGAGHRTGRGRAHRRAAWRTPVSRAGRSRAGWVWSPIAPAGFLTLRGRRLQTARWTEQLGFWAPEDEVGTNHVVYSVSPGTFR